MGFWAHLFGHMAADSIRENQKEKQRTAEKASKWRQNYDMLEQKQAELNAYLASVKCVDTFIFDARLIETGGTMGEVRKMEKIRANVEEYIALGGDPTWIFNLDHVERRIGVLKYLRKIGQIHRQYEFLDDNKYSVEDKIKAEQEALAKQEALLKAAQLAETVETVNDIVGSDIDSMSGIDFEGVCKQLVEKMGFKTQTTKASGDGGIDLIAYNSQPLLSGKYIIQCKRYSGSVGEPIIRDLYGVVTSERANKGILMTTGVFTKQAQMFAEGKPIELIDGVKLKELLLQYGLYNESKKASVSSHSSNKKPFDPAAFMGYYYSDFLSAKEAVKQSPSDIRTRCKLIHVISNAIDMRLALCELGDKGAYTVDYQDLQNMVSLCRESLQPLIQFDNSNSPNKRLKFIFYTALLLDAEYSVLCGDFVNAVKQYSRVLSEFTELKQDESDTLELLYSLFGVLSILECHEIINLYVSKYKMLLEKERNYLRSKVNDTLFGVSSRTKLNVIENPHCSKYFIEVSAENLYDECVDTCGDFNLSHGWRVFKIDTSNNHLVYPAKFKWAEGTTILLKNVSVLAERQRETAKRIARQYI